MARLIKPFALCTFALLPIFVTQICFGQNKKDNIPPNLWGKLQSVNYANNVVYTYYITLKNPGRSKAKSKIYLDSITHKEYLLMENMAYPQGDAQHWQKIFPEETVEIFRFDNDTYKRMAGTPVDSCWMFKMVDGPIKAFSVVSEGMEHHFNEQTLIGLQLNDGPIIHFTEQSLRDMVGNNTSAIKYIDRKNYIKAIVRYNSDAPKK